MLNLVQETKSKEVLRYAVFLLHQMAKYSKEFLDGTNFVEKHFVLTFHHESSFVMCACFVCLCEHLQMRLFTF